MDLNGKIAVITGAGKGLGKETAKALAKEGATAIICSRHENDLAQVKTEIENSGGKCECFVVDVTDPNEVENFISKVMENYKKIDILVNNAGYVNDWKPLEENSDEELDLNFKTNVYSVFYFLRKVLPAMKKQNEGTIINISSLAGLRAVPNLAAYSASKFAVVGLTQSVAKELEGTDVRCVALCPGGMNTEMRAKVFGKEDAEKQQSPEFVAGVIRDILLGKVKVPNGCNVIVRHGEITEINEPRA